MPRLPDGDDQVVAEMLAAIIQSSDDAIVSKDLNGIITSWNPGAVRMFGYTEEEAVGRSIMLIIPPERRDEEEEVLSRIRRGERVDHFETERVRKNGSRIQISLTVSPIKDATGSIVGASKVARDISARIQADEALRQSAEVKNQFLSLVSHELRTPISVIVGNGHLLMNRDEAMTPSDRRQAVSDIVSEAERLQRIIENLLLLTRAEAGEAIELDLVHLERLIAIATMTVSRRSPGREIRFDAAEPYPAAMGDAGLITLVLENLIGNADKYSPPGAPVEVVMRTGALGRTAEVHVMDRGMGLSLEDLAEMFRPFYRSAEAKERVQGLGLGLAVCKRALEQMGGRIAAAPRPGGGADFWFTLPLVVEQGREALMRAAAPGGLAVDAGLGAGLRRRPGE